MNHSVYREYELKFYLNAQHFIIINGHKGEVHPHTWEFSLRIALPRAFFVEFSSVEMIVEEYFAKYQNQILNEIEPFTTIQPTVENMTDVFAMDLWKKLSEYNCILSEVRNSETPTRTYIVSFDQNVRPHQDNSEIVDQAIEHALDEFDDEA